jgi:N-acetylmuramoyl-L-alanine amidase
MLLSAPAAASVTHTVMPGETLWSIAAANGFTTRAFAAANGLSPDAQVVLGSTIQIPSVSEAAGALSSTPAVSAGGDGDADADDGPSGMAAAPPALGGYTVRPGDSLSAIAARARVPAGQIAFMNGLDPRGVLLAGTVIKLPTGAPAPSSAPVAAPRVIAPAAPHASPGRLSSSQVGQVAASDGVSPSLAAAIAYQESGFNNGMVSSANARGVMQLLPGTWAWVQGTLAHRALDPNSALDNVHAGSLYLGSLLRSTGGNAALAAGAYYQGLGSVRRVGLLPATQRYVNNVMALRSCFGGP